MPLFCVCHCFSVYVLLCVYPCRIASPLMPPTFLHHVVVAAWIGLRNILSTALLTPSLSPCLTWCTEQVSAWSHLQYQTIPALYSLLISRLSMGWFLSFCSECMTALWVSLLFLEETWLRLGNLGGLHLSLILFYLLIHPFQPSSSSVNYGCLQSCACSCCVLFVRYSVCNNFSATELKFCSCILWVSPFKTLIIES